MKEKVVVNNNTSKSGIGLAGILTIIFVLLRAFNVITWSWWWVFAPLWIGAGLGILIFIFVMAIVIIAALVE